jgi:putative transposase
MKLFRTIKLQLPQDPVLVETIRLYTNAFNFVCDTGFPGKITNGITLHRKTYETVREYLPAQLACSARVKATEALKSVFARKKKIRGKKRKTEKIKLQKCPYSKQMAIRLDARSYTLWGDRKEVSILTIDGRRKCQLNIAPHYQEVFSTWKNTSADLVMHRDKTMWLHIVFEKDAEDPKKNGKVIGIDRGINNLAVSSLNKFYSGGEVKRVSQKYQELRSKLQKCGSKSAKRHLKKLSGKEQRFRKDVNHCISKTIINDLLPGDIIVLEQLTGIRTRTNRLRKLERTKGNHWAFFQLEQFLTYKGLAKGIAIEFIDARYTSQKCSHCGFTAKKNRITQSDFKCKQCGFRLNADLNAARNIALKYLESQVLSERVVVNQPIAVNGFTIEQQILDL